MLYVIGDLHLGIGINKTMNNFGENWFNHWDKLKESFSKLKDDDTIVIVGDISWGMNISEAYDDLKFIESFKGYKYLVQGNHDYWFSSINKLNNTFNLNFIKHGYFFYGEYAICVTRGSVCPNKDKFTEHDEKIYKRECNRLKMALQKSKDLGYNKFIVLLHYPPTNDNKDISLYVEIIESFKVEFVYYGHIHGSNNFNSSLIGNYNGVKYELVSSDFLNFVPKKIL